VSRALSSGDQATFEPAVVVTVKQPQPRKNERQQMNSTIKYNSARDDTHRREYMFSLAEIRIENGVSNKD
jgi:hypothetical protein